MPRKGPAPKRPVIIDPVYIRRIRDRITLAPPPREDVQRIGALPQDVELRHRIGAVAQHAAPVATAKELDKDFE